MLVVEGAALWNLTVVGGGAPRPQDARRPRPTSSLWSLSPRGAAWRGVPSCTNRAPDSEPYWPPRHATEMPFRLINSTFRNKPSTYVPERLTHSRTHTHTHCANASESAHTHVQLNTRPRSCSLFRLPCSIMPVHNAGVPDMRGEKKEQINSGITFRSKEANALCCSVGQERLTLLLRAFAHTHTHTQPLSHKHHRKGSIAICFAIVLRVPVPRTQPLCVIQNIPPPFWRQTTVNQLHGATPIR